MSNVPPPPPPPPPSNPYGSYGYGSPGGPGPKPDNKLVWAILVTLFCCLPFGVVAIVNAAKVDSLWASGDYAGARDAADKARKWSLWGAFGWLAGVAVYILALILIVAIGEPA